MTTATVKQKLTKIKLSELRANPLNPRKNFGGKPQEDLIASVREKGVISPIMVRPVDEEKAKYEIIFGERRFRASCYIAKENGGLAKHQIPALVRELDDSEAFDLMTIENLQRNDLTEYEEAVSFKQYGERNGDDSLSELAEKVSISISYIKRRIIVLDLPKYCMESWAKGDLKYGHLEVLARLGDRKQVRKFHDEILERNADVYRGKITVSMLKGMVADKSPSFDQAMFDRKEAGCGTCPHNSDVQKTLFDMDSDNLQCNKPTCFKKKQAEYLTANWESFAKENELPTTGFRFRDDVDYNDYHIMGNWEPTPEECRNCDKFLTVLDLSGSYHQKKFCFGEESCYKESMKRANAIKNGETAGSGNKEKSSTRCDWHGSYFREQFYQEVIEDRIVTACNEDVMRDRLTLFTMLKAHHHLTKDFALRHKMKAEREIDEWTYLHDDDIFSMLEKLDGPTLKDEVMRSVGQIAIQNDFQDNARHLIAGHIGIDLAKEWHATDEYFSKKTKAEILEFGEATEVFKDDKVIAYLENTLGRAIGDIPKLKKGELVSLFMESGVDLVGKVPDEVLNA